MFIRQLTYLSALASERHFGRAAALCHVSQPALSGAIQKLEQELGVIIVQRGRHFEGLTSDGERILLWARRILADCEALKQAALPNPQSLQGILKMGCIPTTLPIVSFLIEACALVHPNIQHQIYTISAAELRRKIKHFELDLGLSYLDTDPDCDDVPLFKEHYVLVANRNHPFAQQRSMSWADAAKLPLCLLTPNMQSRHGIDVAFAQAGTQVQPLLESDSLTVLCGHIQRLNSYSILPHSVFCLNHLAEAFSALPLLPNLQRHIGLIVRKGQPHTPLVQAAMQVFQTLDIQAQADALRPSLSVRA